MVASGGLGLVENLAVRQCLLEFFYAFVGDLGAIQGQPFKLGQSSQVHQTGVGDMRIAEVQPFKAGQTFQVLQAGVGDLGSIQVQPLKP